LLIKKIKKYQVKELKMFYSFMGENPFIFLVEFCISYGTFEFVSGVSTHIMREEVGHPLEATPPFGTCRPPPL
jgi:hypothetical protein